MTNSHLNLLVLISACAIGLVIANQPYECPNNLTTSKVMIQTCQEPSGDGSCPSGSTGLSVQVGGSGNSTGNVPKLTWGLLQEDESYSLMLKQFFEMDASGQRVSSSVRQLSSWKWTFCQPTSSSGSTALLFFGTSNGQGVRVSAAITNSPNTTEFKWSLEVDDYQLTGPNNLVLFASYQDEDGDSFLQDSDGEIVNGHSFISTAATASLNDDAQVQVSSDDYGIETAGYYVVFSLIDASVSLADPFHLFLDPTMGITSAAHPLSVSSLFVFAIFLIASIL